MEWETYITKIEPNVIVIRGIPIQKLIRERDFIESLHLILHGEFPDEGKKEEMMDIFLKAACLPIKGYEKMEEEDVSKVMARHILMDESLVSFEGGKEERAAFLAGRMMAYLASLYSSEVKGKNFGDMLSHLTGGNARMLEAMVVASMDHGVTPPSVQATRIAASTRASYEVAVAEGIAVITDVHGGAGMKAAEFLKKCMGGDVEEAVREMVREYMERGERIKGLGHRIHSRDPRKEELLKIAREEKVAGDAVRAAEILEEVFYQAKGKRLPLNVDGAIGAIVADMGIKAEMAKLLFIYGRIAGLSAHYFEEVETQPPMRRIDFSKAVYKGKEVKDWEP